MQNDSNGGGGLSIELIYLTEGFFLWWNNHKGINTDRLLSLLQVIENDLDDYYLNLIYCIIFVFNLG